MIVASTHDFRAAAQRRLPRMLFEYIDGGAVDEVTTQCNVADFRSMRIRQRVMRDMSEVALDTELLGETWSMPVGLAPVGMAGMYARRGEVQAARAAARAGIPFCLSTVGICSPDEVRRAARPPWFQLYVLKDRGAMRVLLDAAWQAGCRVLVLTVDLPTPGIRYRDVRSGFTGGSPSRRLLARMHDGITHPGWLWDVWVRGRPHGLGSVALAMGRRTVSTSDFLAWMAANFDRSVTWADMEWIRSAWQGPIVVKGVLDPGDAREARGAGADAIVVSNHGGRQLDGVRSSISALPRIADAVGTDLPLLLDGGVRTGLDVLRALAAGARACLIGRPWAYALGADGERGVTKLLDLLRAELATAMVLAGCRSVRSADRSLLDTDFGAAVVPAQRAGDDVQAS